MKANDEVIDVICDGITRERTRCQRHKLKDNRFCNLHQYLNDFDNNKMDTILDDIKNHRNDNYNNCKRCYRWYLNNNKTNCDKCIMRTKEHTKNRKAQKDKIKQDGAKDGTRCKFIYPDTNLICGKILKDNGYCISHQYLVGLTDDELKNLTKCNNKSCGRFDKTEYKENGDIYNSCRKCRAYGESNRKKAKEGNITKCKWDGCEFKEKESGFGYCGKHAANKEVEEALKNGKKVCSRYNNGIGVRCRNILPDNYDKLWCENCCNKNTDKYKNNKEKALDTRKDTKIYNDEKERLYMCSECPANSNLHTLDNFDVDKDENVDELCKLCREERREQLNKVERSDKALRFKGYRLKAKKRNLIFELDRETCYELFLDNCVYCNRKASENDLNGIDRVDNTKGYINGNIVSACWFCNMLKNVHNTDKFMKKIEHILCHLKISKKEIKYDDISININSCSYKIYVSDLKRRKLEMKLNEKQYDAIKMMDCYICGKESNENHKNGIDRIDNNDKCYELGNCAPCCYDCNIMKRDNTLNDTIYQLYKIHIFYGKNTLELNTDIDKMRLKIDIKCNKLIKKISYNTLLELKDL